MEELLVRSGAVLLYIFLFSCLVLTVLGLGGNWIIALSALELALKKFGADVEFGKGVAAAQEILLEAY